MSQDVITGAEDHKDELGSALRLNALQKLVTRMQQMLHLLVYERGARAIVHQMRTFFGGFRHLLRRVLFMHHVSDKSSKTHIVAVVGREADLAGCTQASCIHHVTMSPNIFSERSRNHPRWYNLTGSHVASCRKAPPSECSPLLHLLAQPWMWRDHARASRQWCPVLT